MSKKGKLRATFDIPGDETKTFEADFVMAMFMNEDGKSTSANVMACGHSSTHELIKAWSAALVSTIKSITPNAKRRSLLYESIDHRLKEAIKEYDPDALDENGELLVSSLVEKFVTDILKGSDEEAD